MPLTVSVKGRKTGFFKIKLNIQFEILPLCMMDIGPTPCSEMFWCRLMSKPIPADSLCDKSICIFHCHMLQSEFGHFGH